MLRVFALASCALTLGACYHAGRHAIADQALEDFRDAKIGESLAGERELSDKMLSSELAAVRKATEADRDLKLAHVFSGFVIGPATKGYEARSAPPAASIGPTSSTPQPPSLACVQPKTDVGVDPCLASWSPGSAGSLLCAIDRRLHHFFGVASASDLEKIRDCVRKQADRSERASKLETDRRDWKLMGRAESLPECSAEEMKKFTPESFDHPIAKSVAKRYQRECKQLLNVAAASEQCALGGWWADAQAEVKRLEDSIAEANRRGTELMASYVAAKKKVDEAKEPGELTGKVKDASAEVGKLTGALCEVSKAIGQRVKGCGQKAAPAVLGAVVTPDRIAQLGEQIVSLEIQSREIGDALDRIAQDKPQDDSLAEHVLAAALELDNLEKNKDAAALALQAQHVGGQLEYAKRELDHAKTQLELRRQQLRAADRAGKELLHARDMLLTSSQCASIANQYVWKVLSSADDEQKRVLSKVLIHYAGSWSLGEVPYRVALLRAVGDRQTEALDLSQAALDAWSAAFGVPMQAVMSYYASGVKPEEVARIVADFVGLAGIAGAIAIPK